MEGKRRDVYVKYWTGTLKDDLAAGAARPKWNLKLSETKSPCLLVSRCQNHLIIICNAQNPSTINFNMILFIVAWKFGSIGGIVIFAMSFKAPLGIYYTAGHVFACTIFYVTNCKQNAMQFSISVPSQCQPNHFSGNQTNVMDSPSPLRPPSSPTVPAHSPCTISSRTSCMTTTSGNTLSKTAIDRRRYFAGFTAGCVSRTCTAPIDRLKVLRQAAVPEIVGKSTLKSECCFASWHSNLHIPSYPYGGATFGNPRTIPHPH